MRICRRVQKRDNKGDPGVDGIKNIHAKPASGKTSNITLDEERKERGSDAEESARKTGLSQWLCRIVVGRVTRGGCWAPGPVGGTLPGRRVWSTHRTGWSTSHQRNDCNRRCATPGGGSHEGHQWHGDGRSAVGDCSDRSSRCSYSADSGAECRECGDTDTSSQSHVCWDIGHNSRVSRDPVCADTGEVREATLDLGLGYARYLNAILDLIGKLAVGAIAAGRCIRGAISL